MKPTLALSTCWLSPRHKDGYAMLQEVADLGFSHVELSHGIRITLVPGILRALAEGVVKVSSTHNFCPLPAGITRAAPNLYEPSARDKREHAQWLRHTRRSIDFAAQTGARALVVHLGHVEFFWANPARRLRRWLELKPETDVTADPAFLALLDKCRAKMRKRLATFWARVRTGIDEILPYAREKGVRLGFENRERFEELPMDADFGELFAGLPADAPAGYWHDTGHAQIKHRQGLLQHRTQLEQNAARLVGFHLHDVDAAGHDHQAVGAGQVDFKMVREFWRPEHLLVLELSPHLPIDQVRASKARIEELLG